MSWNTAIQFNKLYQAFLSLSASAIKNPLTANLNLAGYNLTSGGTITATTVNGTNLNGKLSIVGQTTTTNGNIIYCNNSFNTTGNFDLLTDSSEHFRFTGGSGAGSNILTIGGATNGGITIPSTAGIITANKLSSNASSSLQLESGSNLNMDILAGGTGVINLTTNSVTRATINSAGINCDTLQPLTGATPLRLKTSDANYSTYLSSAGSFPASTQRGLFIHTLDTGTTMYCYSNISGSGTALPITFQSQSVEFKVGTNGTASRAIIGDAETKFIIPDSTIGSRTNQVSIGKNHLNGAGNNGALFLGFIGSELTAGVNTAGTIASLSDGSAWQPMRYYAGVGDATKGTTENPFSWYVSGTRVQQMTATGLFTVSDERLKNTIQPIDSSLDKILLLKPSTFYYNTDTNKENLVSGFISQEIEPLFPHLISESKVRDDDETRYKYFNPVQLIPYLTKAIQEQQAQITSLQAQLKALAEATGHLLL